MKAVAGAISDMRASTKDFASCSSQTPRPLEGPVKRSSIVVVAVVAVVEVEVVVGVVIFQLNTSCLFLSENLYSGYLYPRL